MRPDFGTVTQTGRINNTTDKVRSIEFHADPDNTGKIRVGLVAVSATNGRSLPADGSFTMNFDGEDGPGSVLFNVLYCHIITGGDVLDWAVILR